MRYATVIIDLSRGPHKAFVDLVHVDGSLLESHEMPMRAWENQSKGSMSFNFSDLGLFVDTTRSETVTYFEIRDRQGKTLDRQAWPHQDWEEMRQPGYKTAFHFDLHANMPLRHQAAR